MSAEQGPQHVGSRSDTPFTRVEKFAYYTNEIAAYHDLDRLTYEALSKFAIVSLRLRELKTDFRGTTVSAVKYPAYIDDAGRTHKLLVTRGSYGNFINVLSKIAHDLQERYLSESPGARSAASEVQVIVNEEFPIEP
jgi:hypothetical protein